MKSPPEKHSKLILLAVKDLEKCEEDKRYIINLSEWHTPNSRCAVCFAGAVMAKTLKKSRDTYAAPSDFTAGWDEAFCFLNDIAFGSSWVDGHHYQWPEIPDYYDGHEKFKSYMRGIAAWFETQGD